MFPLFKVRIEIDIFMRSSVSGLFDKAQNLQNRDTFGYILYIICIRIYCVSNFNTEYNMYIE